MCYAKNNDAELKKEDWFHIFDMAHENGLLYALLTGGEIFLNPDFIEIYNYLYDLGVKVTLFTNGSLLNHKILNALKKRPPEMVAITIYGYDEASYQKFTKTSSFKDVNRTIDLLKSNHINLYLRTIPMPEIYQHLDQMIDYVKSKELHLGYFMYVSKVKGQERLSAKDLIDFEYRIKKAFPLKKEETHQNRCGAFKNGYFINHKGYMQACPMMPEPTEKVEDDLTKTFKHLKIQWQKLIDASPCKHCALEQTCMTCVARRYLEGNVFQCAKYLKDIALEKSNA
jgi:radical SAM protein with 4Fe4S-binding SPASM domain